LGCPSSCGINAKGGCSIRARSKLDMQSYATLLSRPGPFPVQTAGYHLRIVISVLDPDATEQADLRGGRSPWLATGGHAVGRELTENMKCEALVVGGGITGSLVAERLTRQGLDVVLVDRELPGRGSTAASTSMLLWEIDRSLSIGR